MLIHGDCLEKLKELEDNSVDSIVTDPPYGLSFMGKKWDYDVPSQEVWEECLRVLKPGGYLLSFAGTRTQHRMAVNIEDAGFEIRDMIAWVYASGFPKSLNIGKAIEKIDSVSSTLERDTQVNKLDVAGINGTEAQPNSWDNNEYGGGNAKCSICGKWMISGSPCQCPKVKIEFNSERAKQWEGWGTALKPALEPITVARKPLSEKSVAENVLKWGTGGINIDGSRVEYQGEADWNNTFRPSESVDKNCWIRENNSVARRDIINRSGRFPANLIHDGSDEVVSLFPDTGKSTGGRIGNKGSTLNMMGNEYEAGDPGYGDNGSAARFFKVCNDSVSSTLERDTQVNKLDVAGINGTEAQPRLFYCAKASKADRDEGLDGFEDKQKVFNGQSSESSPDMKDVEKRFTTLPKKNNHPTVKPTKLMQYLVKLVTPKGGVVLDPFMGSGSTGKACKLEGFAFIGIEKEEEYIKIAEARINAINTLL